MKGHTYFDIEKQELCCKYCGRTEPCKTPMDSKVLIRKITGFDLLHKDCKQVEGK